MALRAQSLYALIHKKNICSGVSGDVYTNRAEAISISKRLSPRFGVHALLFIIGISWPFLLDQTAIGISIKSAKYSLSRSFSIGYSQPSMC